ncbi:LuxR C-terminal-related transcriptional regulator [Amycolatopsis aidingensis]|uniref:LuxR C-terminal-related transcriptional regulator n=1 Tax=Amycolatopsis aidingensis TaxID=2842453 RepID=UPI001C0A983B|nr:LuxR C-terminal-related transcriptional regulator [Amycolatopsis aidingensis]
MEASAITAAKIRTPPPARQLVERRRLLELLDAAGNEPGPAVTLLRAAAGTGKTVLLADWARRCRQRQDGPAVAWVSIEAEDNDIRSLSAAVTGALLEAGGREPDRGCPGPARSGSEFLAAVMACCEALGTPLVLVLDDVHELRSPAALRGIDLLLRYLPHLVHLVLTTRSAPPPALSRLLVEGKVREIDPARLVFTRAEAARLLAGHGVEPSGPELDLLLRRTGGWAACLRLAAMSLAGSADPAATIEGLTGSAPAVADYLADEVLARQPARVRRLLLETGVCPAVSVELAIALSGQQDAGQTLDALARTGTLVSREGDGRWYRFHPLLHQYLGAELDRRGPRLRQRLHAGAAEWFLATGDTLAALTHATAAGHDEQVASLLQRFGLQQVTEGRAARLRERLDRVPAHVLARPAVALVAAATALELNDLPATDRCLGRLNHSAHPLRSGWLRALHAAVTLQRARYGATVRQPREVLAALRAGESGNVDVDLLVLINRGVLGLWRGAHRTARRHLERALLLATTERRDGAQLHARIYLAAAAAAAGELTCMDSLAGAAGRFAAERGWERTSRCSLLHTMLGFAAYQRLDRDEARQAAATAVELLDAPGDPTVELSARLLHAAVSFEAAADPHEVLVRLRGHWNRLGGKHLAPALVAYAVPLEQRMALRVGEPAWAVQAAERAGQLLPSAGEHAVLRAALHTHRGQLTAARRQLRAVLAGDLRPVVPHTLIDAWLLEALLAERACDPRRAHEAVARALEVAAPRNARRPFLEAGRQIRELLAGGTGRFGRMDGFAATVLDALPAQPAGTADTLTSRELELLTELPSMRTAEEIAESLFVSVNTVKTHLRGIYRKLGVSHRRDAVTAARRRGLL